MLSPQTQIVPLVGRGPLPGGPRGWELRIFLCESHVTIHE